MCGRYERRGDKQAIAEAFHVKNSLEGVDFGETYDAAPGSEQPVMNLNDAGERSLAIMRWGFKLPDRLLFNARSEGVTEAKFWKDKFAEHRCIVPASAYFEWQDCGKNQPKPKYEIKNGQFVPQLEIAQGRTSTIGMHGDTQRLRSSALWGSNG